MPQFERLSVPATQGRTTRIVFQTRLNAHYYSAELAYVRNLPSRKVCWYLVRFNGIMSVPVGSD